MKRVAAVIAVLMAIALAGCRAGSADKPPDIGDWLGGGLTSAPTSEGQRAGGDPDTGDRQNAGDLPYKGKVVIITTNTSDYRYENNEEVIGAEALAARFGEDRVVHETWPRWDSGVDKLIAFLQGISEDPEVGALVLTGSTTGYTHVIDALPYIRDDIFVVYAANRWLDRAYAATAGADLIIQTDLQRFGESYVIQAKSMGAETIAHYSTPMLDGVPAFAMRRSAMKAAAEREGIGFVDLVAPDPWGDPVDEYMLPFIVQDVPRQVERFGADTAFFCSVCFARNMQISLISQTIATGAIFASADCLSPYHGYPEALEIEYEFPTGETDEYGGPIIGWIELSELLEAIDGAVEAVGMVGRISSPAVPDGMMWITIGGMYALEWLNGNVTHERGAIDIEMLRRLAREYTAELGVDAGVTLEPFDNDGEPIGHYILGTVDFHDFGK